MFLLMMLGLFVIVVSFELLSLFSLFSLFPNHCSLAHASVTRLPRHIEEKYAGFGLHKELTYLSTVIEAPRRPVGAIVGGYKVTSKIDFLKNLIGHVDKLLIGGAMAYTFYKAMGYHVGGSLVEEEALPKVQEIIDMCKDRDLLVLAPDSVTIPSEILKHSYADAKHGKIIVDNRAFPIGQTAMDIGIQTKNRFKSELDSCNTIIFNGKN
jgi:phosphoglycerate kinase